MSEQIVEEIDLEELFRSERGCYVLRARGDSMKDDHILDGDYVVIERRDKCRNGEQAVVIITDTGEATLCRWYQEPAGRVRLQKANAASCRRRACGCRAS
jgi:repressor LexA